MDLLQRVCRPIHRWMDGCDAMRCCWHLEKSNSFCMRDDVSSFTSTPQWGNKQHAQIRMHWSTISKTLCYFSTTQNALSFKKGFFFSKICAPSSIFRTRRSNTATRCYGVLNKYDCILYQNKFVSLYVCKVLWISMFL